MAYFKYLLKDKITDAFSGIRNMASNYLENLKSNSEEGKQAYFNCFEYYLLLYLRDN